MGHRANSAALQLVGFVLGAVGWIGSVVATGLVQWRVWHMSLVEVTSGIAWVGIWRVCFYSQALTTPPFRRMSCQRLGALDQFVPPEIGIAQGLLLVAVVFGALGKATTIYGLRNVYFGGEQRPRLALVVGGGLHLLACVCVVIPAVWNLSSVVSNQAIAFPPHFHLPGSPQRQELGAAVYIAIFSAALLFLAGVFLVSYGPATVKIHPSTDFSDRSSLVSGGSLRMESCSFAKNVSRCSLSSYGVDSPAFDPEDNL
ncbi:claudin-34 [Carcharodon carcharias]|uniref:claudin-34 n=1 Tax=Carcharodon carcharias TaxID=13397 RepID=UPI001B7E96D5|nr:claudin-34 [Carcharodon carcharias]